MGTEKEIQEAAQQELKGKDVEIHGKRSLEWGADLTEHGEANESDDEHDEKEVDYNQCSKEELVDIIKSCMPFF